MTSRVERADAVGGTNVVVAQVDEPRSGTPAGAGAVIILPPAQLITQAQENLGIDLPSPGKRSNRIGNGIGRHGQVQSVLRELVSVPLNDVKPSGGSAAAPVTADTIRRHFFDRRDAVAATFMRDYNLTREQAEAAADQLVGRNVARWQYQRREHRGDGLRALTAAGMLLAIAQAGGDVDPQLLAAARTFRDDFRNRLIIASTTPGSDPDEVARQVDAYLNNLGGNVNRSTAGWGEEVRVLREAEYYRPFNPASPTQQQGDVVPFQPPQYVRPQHAEIAPLGSEAHSEAMRRADRAAGAEHAVRVAQRERDDLKAHLANLEAQGRPVGGPTYS